MIEALKRLWVWLNEPAFGSAPKQTTWCWCPDCGEDLCTKEDVRVDAVDDFKIMYHCPCGNISTWDFGNYPVPVLLYHGHLPEGVKHG